MHEHHEIIVTIQMYLQNHFVIQKRKKNLEHIDPQSQVLKFPTNDKPDVQKSKNPDNPIGCF